VEIRQRLNGSVLNSRFLHYAAGTAPAAIGMTEAAGEGILTISGFALTRPLWHASRMPKPAGDILIDPSTLVCPRCGAKPKQPCDMLEGKRELVHVERIRAAAKDLAATKARRK
jgi:hypothetical protein